MKLFAVYGAGGCGRGVMPIVRSSIADDSSTQCVFIDDGMAGSIVNDCAVFSLEQFLQLEASERRIAIAVANPAIRQQIAHKCEDGVDGFFEVRDPTVVQMDSVEIGIGGIFSPYAVLTSNIVIGRHFHCNIHSIVEHDCIIGDFVTFAPGVRCNGNVHIGDGAYIGANAVIRQGRPDKPLRIGKGATVGMGAVVLNDVADGETVVGNPARAL